MALLAGGGRWSGPEELRKWHLGESFRSQERVGMGPSWLMVLDSVGKVHPYCVTELYVTLESLCRMLTGI